jgi:hypothetical protein
MYDKRARRTVKDFAPVWSIFQASLSMLHSDFVMNWDYTEGLVRSLLDAASSTPALRNISTRSTPSPPPAFALTEREVA